MDISLQSIRFDTQNMEEKDAPINRDIELFLHTSQFLELDFDFGFNQLNMYLQDLQALKMGARFKDLGIAERRRDSMPKLLVPDDSLSNYNLVSNWDIMDGNVPKNSIALLKLSGVMRSQSGLSSPGVDRLSSDLRSAYNNPNITGIVLETLSGGGESMAGNLLKSTLSERNKPVIGFGHLVASAAYRALTGADEIVMSSTQSEVGSIGTMISLDMVELTKFRERFSEFYGTDAPKKNGEIRQAIAGNFSGIQERVDELTREFHNEIKRDRTLQGDKEKVAETLSGKMFNATQGKQRGLVDAVGNLPYAIRRVNALKSRYN